MEQPKLAQWLKDNYPDGAKGKTCFVVRKDNGGENVSTETIASCGRQYVTLGNVWQTRFYWKNEGDKYLSEDSRSGYSSMLFSSKTAVDRYLEHQELGMRLLKKHGAYARTVPLERLKAAVAIMEGDVPDDTVDAVLAALTRPGAVPPASE